MNDSSPIEISSVERAAVATADHAFPWRPDQGDGHYRNPIIYADYSDPDVVRVGRDFYLVSSSFNCTPGLPLLHSRDLVNWTIIGHAVKNLPHPRYAEVQPGCGVWAPSIRFHAGRYWIFFPMPDEGIYVVTAENPAGIWSEPHLVQAGKGLIDPCPLWDDDGQAYLVHAYAGSRAGIKHRLRVCPMASDGSRLLGDGRIVFHELEKHPTIEGPKFLKRDGWYYILAPAGGVETGWQVVLRSKDVYGPFEDKIVLAQGSSAINGPHQGALVDTADDDWWFIHFQDAGVYGRIVHLQPVVWKDGWPLVGRNGQPVSSHHKPCVAPVQKPAGPQTSDDFEAGVFGRQWQWHANHQDDWFVPGARPGWLRLLPQPASARLNRQPNLLLQKFPARSFTGETVLQLAPRQDGEEAGLVVVGESYCALGVRRIGTKNRIALHTGDQLKILGETVSNGLRLRVAVQDGGRCVFGFSEGGDFASIPGDFQAQKGVWIGAKLGLYSVKPRNQMSAGYADFDYFRFK